MIILLVFNSGRPGVMCYSDIRSRESLSIACLAVCCFHNVIILIANIYYRVIHVGVHIKINGGALNNVHVL